MGGEWSTALGGCGTVMRHFSPTAPFAAPEAVAALALGMAVPAASRLLVTPPRRASRFASGKAATAHPAVLLPAVTARADEHLALASGTQKQPGIVHRSPRRGGLDDPTSPGNTALGAVRKCGSGRSPGHDRQVFESGAASASSPGPDLTPTLERRHRLGARRPRRLNADIGSDGKQQVSGGGAGTTQSAYSPPARPTWSEGLFAKYTRFYVAINSRPAVTAFRLWYEAYVEALTNARVRTAARGWAGWTLARESAPQKTMRLE